MSLAAVLALVAASAPQARATGPCDGQTVPADAYCVPGDAASLIRPSRVLSSSLNLECKNWLLTRYSNVVSTSTRNFLGSELRTAFGDLYRTQACYFEPDSGAEATLVAAAQELFTEYTEETVCLSSHFETNCTAVGGTVSVIGGSRYCVAGGVVMDPSCLIAPSRARDLMAAAEEVKTRATGADSCLATYSGNAAIQAEMNALLNSSTLSQRPKHCCGECLSARPTCAGSSTSRCAFTCRMSARNNVVTYTTNLLGGRLGGSPERVERGATGCGLPSAEYRAEERREALGATIFHEYLHAAGLCTDTDHNSDGNRSPHDPVYACERLCFQDIVPSAGRASTPPDYESCVACALGRIGGIAVEGRSGTVSSPTAAQMTALYDRAAARLDAWYATEPMPASPSGVTLPQACRDSFLRYRQSEAVRVAAEPAREFGDCFYRSSRETSLRASLMTERGLDPSGPPPTGLHYSFSDPHQLRQGIESCSSHLAPWRAGCDVAANPRLSEANRVRHCCETHVERMTSLTESIYRNRSHCLQHAFNVCQSPWSCYYDHRFNRCSNPVAEYACRTEAIRTCVNGCAEAAFASCMSTYTPDASACEAAPAAESFCSGRARESRFGTYNMYISGPTVAPPTSYSDFNTRLRSACTHGVSHEIHRDGSQEGDVWVPMDMWAPGFMN